MISANQVKELRERTGLGMMECKAALAETHGDMEKAIDVLRKKAGAKVEKKAARTAADGAIGLYVRPDRRLAAMAEVNSETDFVAKDDKFTAFAHAVAAAVAAHNPASAQAAAGLTLDGGKTIEQRRAELVSTFGENMSVRRLVRYESAGHVGVYVHGRKIGVLVEMEGGDEALAKDIAMHIAASRPVCVRREDVPAEVIAKEKEVFVAQAATSGKPPEIVEKMVSGRVNKFLSEVSLLGQPFVRDPDTTVEKLLKVRGARVLRFARFEVGEGIEKAASDFAAEVMAQVKGG